MPESDAEALHPNVVFQDYATLIFLGDYIPKDYKDLGINRGTLVNCLKLLSTYCANKEMYCKKLMENMKAQKESVTFHDDKHLLNLFDNKMWDILGINGAY